MKAICWLLTAALVAAAPMAVADERTALTESESWNDMRFDVVGDAELLDGANFYTLEAPFRAEDAATVPLRFTQAEGAPDVRRLTLVIDENPAPVAAVFDFGPAMQPLDLETRVRVDAYTNIRAIVEGADGETYMIGRYVRASGGCSAPAAKDAVAALESLGQMRARWFDEAPAQVSGRREAQVMLRHPNYSGLQRDQITLLFVPARFVDTIEVRAGAEVLFTMTGGISISEDPTFRFSYTDHGAGELSVHATDTDGQSFAQTFSEGS
jgi:sulfur-oxidizing protein SoxY